MHYYCYKSNGMKIEILQMDYGKCTEKKKEIHHVYVHPVLGFPGIILERFGVVSQIFEL